jgi:site-specific recombinase XerD
VPLDAFARQVLEEWLQQRSVLAREGERALWVSRACGLGHESAQTTRIYEHADPKRKEQAIACTEPPGRKPGRYRPSDPTLVFLDGL